MQCNTMDLVRPGDGVLVDAESPGVVNAMSQMGPKLGHRGSGTPRVRRIRRKHDCIAMGTPVGQAHLAPSQCLDADRMRGSAGNKSTI